jgi:hypothetical protein
MKAVDVLTSSLVLVTGTHLHSRERYFHKSKPQMVRQKTATKQQQESLAKGRDALAEAQFAAVEAKAGTDENVAAHEVDCLSETANWPSTTVGRHSAPDCEVRAVYEVSLIVQLAEGAARAAVTDAAV